MEWAKASDKFPNDPEEKVFRKRRGKTYQYLQTEDFFDEHLIFEGEEIPYHKLEYLDESQPSLTLQQGLDIWDAGWNRGQYSVLDAYQEPPNKAAYFASIGYDLSKIV